MLRNSSATIRVSAAVILLAVLAVAVFAGVSLAGGGAGDPPTLQELPDTTPPPPWISPYPTQDPSLPTQPADDTNRTPDPNATAPGTPESVTISGVDIPIPDGWHYIYAGGGDASPRHQTWKGASSVEDSGSGPVPVGVRFDDVGLTYINVSPSEEAEVEPTLDALWNLTQKVGTASPPSVSLNGYEIPLPVDSYYATTKSALLPGDPGTFRVRFHHSVVIFDSHGLIYEALAAADAGKFEAAIDALAPISAQ